MGKPNTFLLILCAALASFIAGKWTGGANIVKADSPDSPQILVRPISGDSSLIVYYPKMNQFFVYQNPFVGLPTWGCAYSLQLSTPGGDVKRQPCSNSGSTWK
jgi:hypothetical protein